MPSYNFYDENIDHYFTESMSISELEKYLEDNPHIKQQPSAPAINYRAGGNQKPDSSFRDVLKKVKSKHRRSNINTW